MNNSNSNSNSSYSFNSPKLNSLYGPKVASYSSSRSSHISCLLPPIQWPALQCMMATVLMGFSSPNTSIRPTIFGINGIKRSMLGWNM